MLNPLVSIIIPVYNGSNYLREAIDSALAQTYKNIEVIVINDGSNDNGATEAISKSYGKKIRYYYKKNGGVATALNFGIDKMKGEYLSWLSHDDLYYPDKIERQVRFLKTLADKKVLLYSNYAILQGDKITPVIHNHEMLTRKSKYALLRGCLNGVTILIPKAILNEIGQFNIKLRCVQDYDYWQRVQKKFALVHMPEILSITRLHSNQDSVVSPLARTEGNDLWIGMIEALSNKEKILYENTLYNFYVEMSKFLETTPYDGALEYSKRALNSLAKKVQNKFLEKPKVSVIIPFYNRIDKTVKAVKSVLNQTYDNIEVLLINDGSTEDCTSLDELMKDNNNIKLVRLDSNCGPAAARNAGIDRASGEYIAFLDSDDEFLEGKVEQQLRFMLKHNPLFGHTAYFRRQNGIDVVACDTVMAGVAIPKIISNCTIATPTVMIKKEFLDQKGLRFNEAIRVGEDVCLWFEIAKYTDILLVENPLTRIYVDQNTHAIDKKTAAEGTKNLIAYLANDDTYSKYDREIAKLCEYLVNTNDALARDDIKRLSLGEKYIILQPKLTFSQKLKHTLVYRAARKLYRHGPVKFTKTAVSKIRSRLGA